MSNTPIYISGLDRSGKTTLRGFLQSHPNISIPAVGSNMWTYFYNQYGSLQDPENFERCLDAMLKYKHIAFLKPDPDLIRTEFRQGPATYARLFSLFLEHFAKKEGKPRWGSQSGLNERYADEIIEAYPGVKFIQMLRDPRDRYAGSLQLWPKGRLRAGGSVARFLYSTHLAERNMRKYPEAYMLVRFEDLIRSPEKTLREICEFLGEEFYPEMLSMPGAPEHRDKLINRSEKQIGDTPLSDEYIGIYSSVVSKAEIIFLQLLVGKKMTTYGYELEKYSLTTKEWLRYFASTLPSNMAKLLFWYLQEFLQHNFPGQFGRNPASNRILNSKNDDNQKLEKKPDRAR
jgi:hypothetical protein